jgi:cytochrome oxidase Cu insertion factor (SCO1/SenC/PrrC family)
MGIGSIGCTKGEKGGGGNEGGFSVKVEPESTGLRVLGKVPDFVFLDQDSNAFGLGDTKDRVWMANFVFTRCGSTCPLQTAKMAQLQESLKGEPFFSAIRMVSFTVDPEYDTPQVLAEYAAKYQATANWRFLTGARKDIWGFCEKGLMLPVEESGLDPAMPILHSPSVVLIDGKGQIRGYYDGLNDESLEKLKSDLKTALKETSSITGYDR